MTFTRWVKEWIAENRDIAWDTVRIFLGFALVVKGFAYLFNHRALAALMAQAGSPSRAWASRSSWRSCTSRGGC